MEEQQNRTIQCFQRKEELWIGDRMTCGYLDICISEMEAQIHIYKNTLFIKMEKEEVSILWNGQKLQKEEIEIIDGDTLEVKDLELTFLSEHIEIVGDTSLYETNLLLVEGKQEYFEGFPYYKRSPRVIYRTKSEDIEIKEPPAKKEMSKGSIAQMIIPSLCMLAFTIAMGVVLKRGPYVYMTAGMTIITMIFSIQRFITERKDLKVKNEQREKTYEEYLLKTHSKIRKLRKEERKALDYQNPTLEELEGMVKDYNSRIYERSHLDDDFLSVCLGYYRGASQIGVSFAEKELNTVKDPLIEKAKEIPKEYAKIERIPVDIDLKKAHLGLVGNKANVHEQLKYMLAQLTFFQSYHDLQIVFLHNSEYTKDFSYVRWYPHLRIQSINVIAEVSNDQIRDQVLGSIQQILKERKLKLEEEKKETMFLPHLLFIIDEPKLILNHAIMEYLQSKQADLGFSTIYTTDQKANLPENIKTVCILQNSQDGLLLLEEGERKNRSFEIQHTGNVNLEWMARNLASLVHEQGMSSKIPESITFFEMYCVEHPEELKIGERWKKNESHKSLAVPLGVRAEEDYVELNLHEKAHGPHGLVAGTTGSGKSEIVQSYILSLAVNFHPHEVGFLLIDYKGGGMANLFEKLPHLLGTITNLDKAESMRAMASIKSELARRQRIFGECGVNHINGYNKLFKLGKVEEPLPHLFLISDEFAELKKEQPEFMSELVSAARIGRSLGIHLILATQKPSGVVDDQIWTNSKFKLCLKVQNAGDSKEMLHTPDAANITQAGRAYLQVGNNEIYELFQSAWSGASYDENEAEVEKEDDRVYMVNPLGQGELINQDLSSAQESNEVKATQLDATVKYLHELYELQNPVPVKKTWLPSLPDSIQSPYTAKVENSAKFLKVNYTLGIGMIDVPEEQKQEEYVLDFQKNGHLLYMASSGFGKSVFLSNIIVGLSMKNSVRNLNFYILDLGNSGLIALSRIPHVADYMGLDDSEKIQKFQKLILDEITERKRKFARAMAQNIYVYNESQNLPLKSIVIAIDNYDAIKELGDTVDAFIQKVSRDGAGLGIYLLVTMTRTSAMRGVVMNNFKEKIAGFNFEPGENRSLIGRSEYELGEEKKGRALVKHTGINIMQLYTPVPCETELIYNQGLKNLVAQIAEKSTEERAKGIPVLPEELYFEELQEYPGYIENDPKLPVGIDVNSLEVQSLNILEGIALVIGSAETGKTNVVRTLLKKTGDSQVFIFDGEDGVLRGSIRGKNISYANSKEQALELLHTILEIVEERKEMHSEEQIVNPSMTLKQFCRELTPVYVIVDSIQQLFNQINDKEELDILLTAAKYGMRVLITSDSQLKRTTGSELIKSLLEPSEALILGNAKAQSIINASKIREENRKVDLGYYYNRGEIKKVKLINNG